MHSKVKKTILLIFLWIIALVILVPFYYLVVNTLKPAQDTVSNPMSLPVRITFQYYVTAWKEMKYLLVFFNTFFNTVVSVAFVIFISSMAAYSIVRRDSRFHKLLYGLFISSIMVPFVMMIVPIYKIIKDLHMMNTRQGAITIYIATSLPFVIFMYCSFIKTINREIEEAARVDGCSTFRTFWNITFPMLVSVSTTVAILTAISVWNDFIIQTLFIQSSKLYTITRSISMNVGRFRTDWTLLMPMFVLGLLPVLIFYLFMQDYIIKGVAVGGVKG